MPKTIARIIAAAIATAAIGAATAPAAHAGGYTYGAKGSCWNYSTATSKPYPAYREYYNGRPTGRCINQ